MNYQLTGKLHAIFDTQEVTQTFRKREFVVEYADNPMYPQYVLFQVIQDRCALLDGFQVGDMVEVTFNLRGRSWNPPDGGDTKYFNSLEAWRISPAPATGTEVQTPEGTTQTQQQGTPMQGNTPTPQTVDVTQMDDDDDLPF